MWSPLCGRCGLIREGGRGGGVERRRGGRGRMVGGDMPMGEPLMGGGGAAVGFGAAGGWTFGLGSGGRWISLRGIRERPGVVCASCAGF